MPTPAPAAPPGSASARPARRGLFALLIVLALLLHGLLVERVGALLIEGGGEKALPRLQAVFVRELQPAVPPPVPTPTPAAVRTAKRAALPAPAASAAIPAPPAPDEAPDRTEPVAIADEPASAPPADPPVAEASAAPAPASSAPAGPTFAWPASTRLGYRLTGDVRGEVHGSAQVLWLSEGSHYQVHLDVLLGPRFAPLMQRRMSSDGEITSRGLAPRRYQEETQVGFAAPRRASMSFDDEGVTLANGQRAATLPTVQDTASQFVQLTYLFSSGTEALKPGVRIEVPLALPRRVDRWVYEVIGEEILETPVGRLPTWHLKPQRVGDASALSIEAWFAPSLQYLPVRIVLRQGPDNHVDLLIDALPQQEEPSSQGGSSSGVLPR